MLSSLVCLFLAASTAYFLWSRQSEKRQYPPGPRPLPVLGNIFDFTPKELWIPAHEWIRKYGDVCFLHVLNWNLVFLGSNEAADELLDRRGAIYSNRPQLQMTGEMCGLEKLTPFVNYNETFRSQRRHMQQTLGKRIVPQYHSLIQDSTAPLVHNLVESPHQYLEHLRRHAGGLTLSVVYGYRPKDSNDRFLRMAQECLAILANEVTAGGGIWAVDIAPILKYLPEWFPGCEFKRKAAIWKAKMTEFIEEPFAHAKISMKNGTILPSFCSNALNSGDVDERLEDQVKNSANAMFAASADTTIATMSQFFLAMLQYPETMRRAQEEIDRVVGGSRLPNHGDRELLPYVEALFSEVLRWGAPVPLNLPHCSTEDAVYNKMFIPKDTILIVNIWSILRDENLFPDPEIFEPERYLNVDPELKARRDPRRCVFGYGRRRCPGADLAESSIWLLMVTILATANIKYAVDEDGKPVKPQINYSNSFFRVPDGFKFDVEARNSQARELIESGAAIALGKN